MQWKTKDNKKLLSVDSKSLIAIANKINKLPVA